MPRPPSQPVDENGDKRDPQQGAAGPAKFQKTDHQASAVERHTFADIGLQGRIKHAFP